MLMSSCLPSVPLQVSTKTRILVLFDFIKTKVFGRDLTNV